MATINGSTNTSVWTFKLVTTEGTANVANNTSPLTVAVYLGRSSSGGASYMWGASISCPIDVTGCTRQTLTYSNSGQVNVAAGAWLLLGSKTFTVPHNADGKKTVTVSASFTNNVSPASGSAKGDVTLATIPRATTPTLSATSVTMGSSITITMSPADSTFKHKLRYEFGTLTGQTSGLSAGTSNYTAAGNTTATFTPPVALGSQIPTANSGTCKILCYTYTSGGTHIGTKELNVTLNVPSYSPTISSVALTGNNLRDGVYVQGKSTVTVTTTASSSYGAGIASYSCTVDGVKYATQSFTTAALKTATTYTITVTVTDGRGKSASKPATAFTVYEYKAPYITSFTAVRQTDPTTVVATLVGGVSSLNSKNGKAFTVTLNGKTLNVSSSGFTVNGSVTFTGIDTDNTFVATASVADYYTSATMPVVVPTEAVTMDYHYSGKGIAMGKVSEESGLLDVAWPIKSPSIDNLLGGYGTAILSGADLNTTSYVNVGTYVCNTNAVAAGLKNCPTTSAFKMTVSNVLYKNPNPNTGANWYLVREITNLYGYKYYQYAHCYAETGWSYSAWFTRLDSYLVKDYVIEQGTYSDGWEYTKWNNGRIELFSFKSLSFPATTKITDYVWRTSVSIDMSSKLKEIRGGSCPVQYEGVVPQLCRHSTTITLAEIMIVTSRSLAAFTKTIPVYIVGKWK